MGTGAPMEGGRRCFDDCYRGDVLCERGTMATSVLTALVLGVGVLRGLVDRDDVGPGGSTGAR